MKRGRKAQVRFESSHRAEYMAAANRYGDSTHGIIVDGIWDCVVACQREADRCLAVAWGKPRVNYFKDLCHLLKKKMKVVSKPRNGPKQTYTVLNMDCLEGII